MPPTEIHPQRGVSESGTRLRLPSEHRSVDRVDRIQVGAPARKVPLICSGICQEDILKRRP